jgi:hypothetical protein
MKIKARFIALFVFLLGGTVAFGQNYGWTTIAGAYDASGSQDGTNHSALLHAPTGVAADGAGDVFVADSGNYVIRKLAAVGTNWVSSTIVGSDGYLGFVDGTNGSVKFYNDMRQIVIDANGNLYLQEYNPSYPYGQPWLIRELRNVGTNWIVNTIYNASTPGGWAVDFNGNFYTATSNTVVKLTPILTNGLPSLTNFLTATLAGAVGVAGTTDGTNSGARFTSPSVFAVTSNGVVYVADSTGIRTVAPLGTNWVVTTLSIAAYTYMTMDSQGNIFGSDSSGPTIQCLGAGTTDWITIGGTNGVSGGTDGTNHSALFSDPAGITVNNGGRLFVADTAGETVRQGVNPAVPVGALQVSLGPTGAVSAGAVWKVAASAFQSNGATVTNLEAGVQVLSFLPLFGWTTPANQLVTIGTNLTTSASGDYVQQFGAVQVVIGPAGATNAGGAWQLDAGAWQSSGVVVSNVPLGSHTVSFLSLPGWITPSNQTVTVANNQTTNLTATYFASGALQVSLQPAGAVSAGAQWQLDGGSWYASGVLVTNLAAQSHTLAFSNLSGWISPTNGTVTVIADQTNLVTALYVEIAGNLQVDLIPDGAVSDGAQWQLDGGAGEPSGFTLTNVAIGSHTVSFSSLADWVSPTNQVVTIQSNVTSRVMGAYLQEGSLQVVLSPSGANTSGAAWEIDGGSWLAGGTTVSGLSPGLHTIGFEPVTGWVAPATQSLTVPAGQTTVTNEYYAALNYAFSTIAGTPGDAGYADSTNAAALFDGPAGVLADGVLYIADTGNSVIRGLAHTNGQWLSSTLAGVAGSPGHADGTNGQAGFDYPSGVAAAPDGSLFIADQVNSTIRRLAPVPGGWAVTTIAGRPGIYGSSDGTNSQALFYYPAALAVDAATNVYVADEYNSTIRKIVGLGSNKWVVTTIAGTAGLSGRADGTNASFYWPGAVAIATNGVLYVADTYNDTIRTVTPAGDSYSVATICGTPGAYGAADGTNSAALFDGPSGLALDSAGSLYVADSYSSLIRKITPQGTNWLVNTIGGLAYTTGSQNGTNRLARFNAPAGVSVDTNGLVYVADTGNQTLRLGTPLASAPQPFAVVALADGIYWEAVVGLSYQFQFKTNLLQSSWVNLGSPISATNSPMRFVDAAATNAQRFYRIVLVAP